MVVAGYLIDKPNVRIISKNRVEFLELKNDSPKKGNLLSIKECAERVFQLAQKKFQQKMKNLVIVNSSLSTFETIQACVEVAEKYAHNVMVIPTLLARITYALECLSKLRNPYKNEVILITIITSAFNESIILKRDESFKLHIFEYECNEKNQCESKFAAYFKKHKPTATVFLFETHLKDVAGNLERKFNPRKCFFKSFQRWNYLISFGGMLWAMDDKDGFDSRYHIANFSNGFEAKVTRQNTKSMEKYILLPDRSSLPCKIYGVDGAPQKLKMFYSSEYYQIDTKFIQRPKAAVENVLTTIGSSKQILGYVDHRGVPFVNKNTNADVNVQKPFSKSIPTTSCASVFSQSLPSATIQTVQKSEPQIKFLFLHNFYAIHVVRNGITKVLADSSGNEWTPLYFSMIAKTPAFGWEAQKHCEKFPSHVIYDIFEVIGKPLNEIKINPKWGYGLIVSDGIVYFQIETPSGPRLFSQEIILAAFLKAMKLQAETNLSTEIKNIQISIKFELNECRKALFKKAAEKINFDTVSFDFL